MGLPKRERRNGRKGRDGIRGGMGRSKKKCEMEMVE